MKMMPDLLPGDAVLYRYGFSLTDPATWLAAIVRRITRCPLNHTALVSEKNGVLMLNEAIGRGIVSRALALHIARPHSKIVIRRPRQPFDAADFVARAESKVGSRYDFASLFWHALVYQLTGRWNGKTGERSEIKQHCAEYYLYSRRRPGAWLATTRTVLEDPTMDTIYSEL